MSAGNTVGAAAVVAGAGDTVCAEVGDSALKSVTVCAEVGDCLR